MFTQFDILVCLILLACTLGGVLSGFLKSFFSLLGWVGAGVLTLYLYPIAAKKMEGVFAYSWIASVLAVVGSYVLALTLVSLSMMLVVGNLKSFRGGGIDRSLGLLFGLFKGIVIVSLMHFGIAKLAGEDPDWLEDGQTYTLTSMGAEAARRNFEKHGEETKEILHGLTKAGEKKAEELEKTLPEKAEEKIKEAVDETVDRIEIINPEEEE